MTRYLLCLAALAAAASAQSLNAPQVLEKTRAAYAALTAVHIVAERDESTFSGGGALRASSECELAAMPGNRYLARLKQPAEEAILVGDGANIWRALVSKKQWTRMSAAALDDARETQDSPSAPQDLHGVLEGVLLYHFLALAKSAQDPVIAKEEDFKLAGARLRGYLVRAHNAQAAFELLVDQQTFLVVRAKEQRKTAEGLAEIDTRVKRLEVGRAVDDSLFAFQPRRGWSEVDMLVLPGERRILLTGEHAANFRLKTLDGEPVALDALRGKVVVLDFWATWCGPCRQELPLIEKLRAQFGDAVQFYGVNDEEPAAIKKFVGANSYRMPVLLDSRGEVHGRYGVHAIPTLLVIGPDGVIRRHFIGSRAEPVLRQAIQSVVDGKA